MPDTNTCCFAVEKWCHPCGFEVKAKTEEEVMEHAKIHAESPWTEGDHASAMEKKVKSAIKPVTVKNRGKQNDLTIEPDPSIRRQGARPNPIHQLFFYQYCFSDYSYILTRALQDIRVQIFREPGLGGHALLAWNLHRIQSCKTSHAEVLLRYAHSINQALVAHIAQ